MHDGVRKVKYVHDLVANAFLNKPNNQYVVNHIDGNKLHNCVSNLEWVSYAQNNQHAYDNGLHGKGERHYKSKLTNKDVQSIRQAGKTGTYDSIAKRYHVSKATIRDVLLNRTWTTT